MPEQLRSLTVILFIAFVVFAFFKRANLQIIPERELNVWRNNWLAYTSIAFLASNFWLYVILSFAFLLYSTPKQKNPLALYFLLITALPPIESNIPGFGLVNFLFAIDHFGILALAVLLPLYLQLSKQSDIPKFGSLLTDKLLLAYILLTITLYFRLGTVTDTIRFAFYQFTGAFLPFYVASRAIKNLEQIKEILLAFILGCMIMAVIGGFEFATHWLLYNNLGNTLGVGWSLGHYLGRGDFLRAIAALGQPIILGYLMVIAIGINLYIAAKIKNKILRYFSFVLLFTGLFASLSRGPWIGAIVLILAFVASGQYKFRSLTTLFILALVFLPTLSLIPGGQKIIDLLPFVGHTETANIDYRADLLTNALIVFQQHPMFGSNTYEQELAKLGMTQGEGIVDVVNTYIWVLLKYGLVGLILFISFFFVSAHKVFNALRKHPDKKSDFYLLGRAIFACLIANMVMIFTVSDILIIPIIYWTMTGFAAVYPKLGMHISNKLKHVLPKSINRKQGYQGNGAFVKTLQQFSKTITKIAERLPTTKLGKEAQSTYQKFAKTIFKLKKSRPTSDISVGASHSQQHFANTLSETDNDLTRAITVAEDFGLARARANALYLHSQTAAYKKALAAKTTSEKILKNPNVSEDTKAHARKIIAAAHEMMTLGLPALERKPIETKRKENRPKTAVVKTVLNNKNAVIQIDRVDDYSNKVVQNAIESNLRESITITERFAKSATIAQDNYNQSQKVAYQKALAARITAEKILSTPNLSETNRAHALNIIAKTNHILKPGAPNKLGINRTTTTNTSKEDELPSNLNQDLYDKAIAAKSKAMQILNTPNASMSNKAHAQKILDKVNVILLLNVASST